MSESRTSRTTPPVAGSSRTSGARRSPFAGHAVGAQPDAAGQVGVSLQARTLAAVALAATWPAGLGAFETALAAACAPAPVPRQPGQVERLDGGNSVLLMRTGPEEFLFVAAQPLDLVARLRAHIVPDVGSVTDLGHARCAIRIEGVRCRDTLAKLFALDLRTPAFPAGEIRLTGHHHVPALLHRLGDDTFDLYVFTTYAFDQLATLADAAREYGYTLELMD